jgi:hypothetical protein
MTAIRTWTTTLVMVALCACACSADRTADGPPVDVDANVSSKTVLALGGRASAGDGLGDRLRDAWPYRVFDALPRPTVFVNGARDDATVARALADQAPLARELRPDIVEVWLGEEDIGARTPIRAFTSEFARLLTELRAAGARRILVADLPAAYGERTARYNSAIHQVVRDAGAEIVALARARIDLGSPRGDRLPDAASQRVIADAFAAAIKSRP